MAGQAGILDNAEERARWEGFQWTDANAKAAKEIKCLENRLRIGVDTAAFRGNDAVKCCDAA